MNMDKLITEINAKRLEVTSWESVGNALGISGGMAYRIAIQGYEPHDNHIRATLGLPELLPAPVCPIHGVVHVRATCPGVKKPAPRWVRVYGHAGWGLA